MQGKRSNGGSNGVGMRSDLGGSGVKRCRGRGATEEQWGRDEERLRWFRSEEMQGKRGNGGSNGMGMRSDLGGSGVKRCRGRGATEAAMG